MSPVRPSGLETLLLVGGRRSWESPELPSLNRLQPRATLVPFPTPELAATLDARQSPLHMSLDGAWEFRLAPRPAEAAAALRRARGWNTVEVPSLWTLQGYDRPHYTNVVMPFDEPPPHVPEQNPTGIYRRSFSVPRGWRRRRIVLGFGGVEGALYVLLNGTPVGMSKDARTPAEFDVTEVVRRDGPNELVAVVVRWSDASFIEDQDQWWHAGLSREVYLYATGATYVADVFARGELDDAHRDGRLSVAASIGGPAAGGELEARLLDPRGTEIATASFAETLELTVTSPRRWSAEDPALYTLVVSLRGGTSESVACRVGFRRVEIRSGRLLVNGRAVLINGVNRHDHDDAPRPCGRAGS